MNLSQVKELLTGNPIHIIITTHRTPDGDALGSSLGVYHSLIQLGHHITVITPNDYPKFLHWLPANDKVLIYEKQTEASAILIAKADLIFCLDFNALHRLDSLGKEIEDSKAVKIMIDHHPQPTDFADFMFSDVSASSTAQLVYEFFEKTNLQYLINKEASMGLYTGILTDTGSFRFPSTSAKTHRIVAELIDKGVDISYVYTQINDNNTVSRLKLLGYSLSEKMQVLKEFNTVIISLSQKDLDTYQFQQGDTEGLVNYGLSISGIVMAIFIKEFNGEISLSLRSRGNFSVNDFARDNFNGGGHVNAAGGKSTLSLEETQQKIISLLPKYAHLLK
jgi:bifunctional oligoribonuclease and PAP phosphatase NrnA